MKKYHPLSLIATLVLSACGGGEDNSGNDNGTPTVTLSGSALSGTYLAAQTICLDFNANQACDSDEPQTTTDSLGRFTFSLPASQQTQASQAWAISTPSTPSRATTSTPLLGYFDGNAFTISPYTHDLVSRTDAALREGHYQSSLATREKLAIASELGLTTQEAAEQKLFGDYLAAGDDHSEVLAREAHTKALQIAQASAEQARLNDELAANNPDKWQSVKVSIRTTREYNRNQDRWQNIRVQEVVYTKRAGDLETTRYDITDWLLDEQGSYDVQQPRRHFVEHERQDWNSKAYSLHVKWDWEYDEHGVAISKGESISAGTFDKDADGLYQYQTTEFSHEGTPVPQDTWPLPEESYCEGFDIQAEFTRWNADKLTELAPCVGHVVKVNEKETLDREGAWVQKKTLTFWSRIDDTINLNGPANSYETRDDMVTESGDTRFVNQLDRQALTLNWPELGQSPFNVTRDDTLSHNGDSNIKLAQVMCGGCGADSLDHSIPNFGKVALLNHNATRWLSLASAYLEQDYLKQASGFSLKNRFFQVDMHQPAGLAQPLALKYAGNNTPFMTQDWLFDNASQTLTVRHDYAAVADIANVWPTSGQTLQGEPMALQASLQLTTVHGLPSAVQTVKIDDGYPRTTPTFANDIFNSPLRWAITSQTKSTDIQALLTLLFGDAPFGFHANRDAGAQAVCGGDDTTIRQELLFAPVAGDMVISVRCGQSQVRQQYLLQVSEPYNGTAFVAELLDFAQGANIYRDEPRQRYPLTFVKQ